MSAARPVALVTGASSGLGRALALEFAASGRDVMLLARDAARLGDVAREVESRGARALVVLADVRDEVALRAALDTALAAPGWPGPLDRVAHAAGVLALGAIDELSADDFRRCLEVNVLGSAHVARVTLPHLERSRGRIVFISSIAGVLSLPGGFSAYAASKWGVRGLAEILRPELAARGVHVMTAFPSILDTPMLAPLDTVSSAPMRRKAAPAVYRVFPWHSADKAARRIVADLEARRRESYLSLGERFAAWLSDAFPTLFTAGLHALVRLRDPGAGSPKR